MKKQTVEMVPLNKIIVEEIDPFLGKDQVIESTEIDGYIATLYYHDKMDCLMVKVEEGTKLLYHKRGGRPTYNRILSILEENQ